MSSGRWQGILQAVRSLVHGGTPEEKAKWAAEEARADDRQRQLLEAYAQWLKRKGLLTPAMLFAEGFSPLSWLASQNIHFLSPYAKQLDFLHPALGNGTIEDLAAALENKEHVAFFLRRLEELAREGAQETRGGGEP